jgi:hypothetical protein
MVTRQLTDEPLSSRDVAKRPWAELSPRSNWLADRWRLFPQSIFTDGRETGQSWPSLSLKRSRPLEINDTQVQICQNVGDQWRVLREVASLDFWGSNATKASFLGTTQYQWTANWLLDRSGRSSQTLRIPSACPNGFDIVATFEAGQLSVSFGGMEQTFETIARAFHWIRLACYGSHRLCIETEDGTTVGWRLEPTPDADGPQDVLEADAINLPRKSMPPSVGYLQNKTTVPVAEPAN